MLKYESPVTSLSVGIQTRSGSAGSTSSYSSSYSSYEQPSYSAVSQAVLVSLDFLSVSIVLVFRRRLWPGVMLIDSDVLRYDLHSAITKKASQKK